MFNKYFGNYLLEQKIITKEQLKEVLLEQKNVRVKLGVLAIDLGYMTGAQVGRVHALQFSQDKKFGELAISEGYLTEEKLIELLGTQKKSNVLLGQALIDKGYFSFEQYEQVLLKYKEESGFTAEEIEYLKNNNINKIVDMFIRISDNSINNMYHEYFELFVRNIVRFIDSEVILEKGEKVDSYEFNHIVMQQIEGSNNIFTGFAGNKKTLLQFASIFAGDQCDDMDEHAKDSLGEFMNCNNGLFLSNLSNEGIELELCPQETKEFGKLTSSKQIYKLTCQLGFGQIDIIICGELPIFI